MKNNMKENPAILFAYWENRPSFCIEAIAAEIENSYGERVASWRWRHPFSGSTLNTWKRIRTRDFNMLAFIEGVRRYVSAAPKKGVKPGDQHTLAIMPCVYPQYKEEHGQLWRFRAKFRDWGTYVTDTRGHGLFLLPEHSPGCCFPVSSAFRAASYEEFKVRFAEFVKAELVREEIADGACEPRLYTGDVSELVRGAPLVSLSNPRLMTPDGWNRFG